jgi:GNAT superfamily N-acetyltransferase
VAVVVRSARIEDAERIARVHVTAWQVAYEKLVPQEYLDGLDIGERTERWRSTLSADPAVSGAPRPPTTVAIRGEVVVGFVNVGCFRDEPENSSAGELWAMYVDPEWWGAGVGDALMAATLDELDRLGAVTSFLWVLQGNGRARRFYERHGWQSDGLIKMFEVNGVEIPEVRYSR